MGKFAHDFKPMVNFNYPDNYAIAAIISGCRSVVACHE